MTTATRTFKPGDHVTLSTDPGVVFTIVRLGRRGNSAEFAVLSAPSKTMDMLANLDRLEPYPPPGDDAQYRAAVDSHTVTTVGGFTVGQRVRVGRGKTEWTIDRFWESSGQMLASLEPVVGYSGTSVHVDRLTAVK